MRLPSHALHGQAPRAAAHAQAAASGGARADAAAQLRVWDAAGAAAAVAPPRLLAWRLLAGDADAAARPLGLDWRRALGVHLWRAPPPRRGALPGLGAAAASECRAALVHEQAAGRALLPQTNNIHMLVCGRGHAPGAPPADAPEELVRCVPVGDSGS